MRISLYLSSPMALLALAAAVPQAAAQTPGEAPATGQYRIQLGYAGTLDAAAAEWASLQERFPQTLGPLKMSPGAAEIPGKGVVYMIQSGPLVANKAAAACAKIKAQGADCVVVAAGAPVSRVAMPLAAAPGNPTRRIAMTTPASAAVSPAATPVTEPARPAPAAKPAPVIRVQAAMPAAVPPGAGQSLEQALSAAYVQSTTLGAQRAQQRATDELVPQALSNWRPTVSVTGNVTRSYSQYTPPVFNPATGFASPYGTSKGVGVQVTQPLYRGGKTTAQTSQATNLVQSGKSQLQATEQSVLLSAVQSYLDVVRDQATVDLDANNETVLKQQLDAEQDRFRVGEVTRTDVALSQASYDQARALHITALGQLASDRATYQRVVGQAPGTLSIPDFKYQLPGSLEDAIAEAESNNPSVIASEFAERAARDLVDIDQGNRLPQVSLLGTYGRTYPAANGSTLELDNAVGAKVNHVDTGSVEVLMNWQLYSGGLTSSQVRQAKQTANQDLILVEDAKRVARQTAISAWQQLQTARANIEAFTSQVAAAQIGAEGTRQQALVGTATVLDSLTAEQNLLTAQVSLVSAKHDALLDSFTLMAAAGRLSAQDLALPVKYYDAQENQNRVGDKLFGTGID